jgi:hypothetical protein
MNRIQNFLLHPKHNSQVDGKQMYDKDGNCTIKGRKLVKQIEIEGMYKQSFQSSTLLALKHYIGKFFRKRLAYYNKECPNCKLVAMFEKQSKLTLTYFY